jgi:peptidoglycan hydrolase-like protein with peptidoglycan-binding domain
MTLTSPPAITVVERGYDTGGADGRAGLGTLRAARAYQQKVSIEPADGHPGTKLLARLAARRLIHTRSLWGACSATKQSPPERHAQVSEIALRSFSMGSP